MADPGGVARPVGPTAARDPAAVGPDARGETVVFSVEECWTGAWLGRTAIVADARGFRLATDADPPPEARLAGTVFPGFHDAHVHLGLVDGTALLDGGIAAVDDLGWDLETARGWPGDPALPEVRIAGQLLTARGGYPSASGWAPPAAACELDAPAAVDRQLAAGAAFVKLALNTDAGPLLDDASLRAVVALAHARGVPVIAHAQGAGQAERAFAAGVDALAHAPWSEHLPDELLAAMAGRMRWVSTLDIHGWGAFDADFVVAGDNVRRFHAAGGDIRYGTDLGNGPLPLGVNERELLALEHAGLDLDALAAAIAPVPASDAASAPTVAAASASASRVGSAAAGARLGRRLSRITAELDPEHPAAWLASARLITPDTLQEQFS